MSQYVHLIGAEQVQSAGHAIERAAETMRNIDFGSQFIFQFGQLVDRLEWSLKDHADRIEAAMKPKACENP